ncbi:hypothetical protein [Niallia circulans]|uniref:hypothetical protein n=1 Tax=Niallia circulans TaxID=1397 RepID=UPI00300AB292
MKKPILIILVFTLSLILIGCNFMEEQKAKSIAENYYKALINEDYEEAFEQLYLYDYTEDRHPTDGTTLSEEEARKFYLQKVNYLIKQKYKIKDYEIENIRYEDGHTFFLEISLNVEQNGESFERSETVDVWEGKAWIIEEDDPFATFRDGKMNFDIEQELQEDGT